jgi:hypothetical protein
MPKPRKAGAAQSLFSISPWQDKAADKEAQPSSVAEGEEQPYHVVELPLICGEQTEPTVTACDPPSDRPRVPTASSDPHPTAHSDSMPWQTRKRKAFQEEEPAQQATFGVGAEARVQDEAPPSNQGGADDTMEGTAVLAILPNNSITGTAPLVQDAVLPASQHLLAPAKLEAPPKEDALWCRSLSASRWAQAQHWNYGPGGACLPRLHPGLR